MLPHAIGCVSFLNTRPMIHGLDGRDDITLRPDVPSRLLDDLESGKVELALCPVIDYQRSKVPLQIVPVGCIGSPGRTLTVRLFSRVPFDQVSVVHADTDSHTSVALMRVILRGVYRRDVTVQPWPAVAACGFVGAQDVQTLLLIGDKVITRPPPADPYPHELDLGEAWHRWTGLPFVFAVWMARQHADLGDIPAILNAQRQANEAHLDTIVARYAVPLGWPPELAREYLGRMLRYEVGPPQLQAIQLFWQKAAELKLIDAVRPLVLHPATEGFLISDL
ncbi:MAG: menaquinone biosynthetic enzyme MqnA/MqnD family protein [Phycisphaerales bacterium]